VEKSGLRASISSQFKEIRRKKTYFAMISLGTVSNCYLGAEADIVLAFLVLGCCVTLCKNIVHHVKQKFGVTQL